MIYTHQNKKLNSGIEKTINLWIVLVIVLPLILLCSRLLWALAEEAGQGRWALPDHMEIITDILLLTVAMAIIYQTNKAHAFIISLLTFLLLLVINQQQMPLSIPGMDHQIIEFDKSKLGLKLLCIIVYFMVSYYVKINDRKNKS